MTENLQSFFRLRKSAMLTSKAPATKVQIQMTINLTPKQQLEKFLDKFEKDVAETARRAVALLCKRLPGAIQIVYDNYNALAIGFGPSERASEAIFSVAVYPRYASLFFLQGAKLPDPSKRLQGSGNVVRYVRIENLDLFEDAEIKELMAQALIRAKVPIRSEQRGKMIIKSVSARQRPRRPAKKR
jgi:hypothetical protein